jgi:hypothetical protein
MTLNLPSRALKFAETRSVRTKFALETRLTRVNPDFVVGGARVR